MRRCACQCVVWTNLSTSKISRIWFFGFFSFPTGPVVIRDRPACTLKRLTRSSTCLSAYRPARSSHSKRMMPLFL